MFFVLMPNIKREVEIFFFFVLQDFQELLTTKTIMSWLPVVFFPNLTVFDFEPDRSQRVSFRTLGIYRNK